MLTYQMLTYQLLFLDLDGTLIDSAEAISPRTLAALRAARSAGCTPIICTGRSRYKTRSVAAQLDGAAIGIHFNGTILHDWALDRTLARVDLPAEVACEATRLLHASGVPALHYGVDEDDRWVYVDRCVPPPEAYAADNAERLVWVSDLKRAAGLPPVAVEAYAPPAVAAVVRRQWESAFGSAVQVYEWDSPRNGGRGLHIHSGKANKAVGAQTVADMLGVPQERTLAIGDHENDVELLRWARLGVCMGDGQPAARACADCLTGTFADDGAAQAIERYVLGQDP